MKMSQYLAWEIHNEYISITGKTFFLWEREVKHLLTMLQPNVFFVTRQFVISWF